MTAHFNFAIEHARDGIVCSIGDDDGLMPEAIARANELLDKEPALPLGCQSVFYVWPGHPDTGIRDKIIIRDTGDEHGVAVEEVRKIPGLRSMAAAPGLVDQIASRWQGLLRAWREVEIDGKTCGVRDVHTASITAQAAWNEHRGVGTKCRASLIAQRLAAGRA